MPIKFVTDYPALYISNKRLLVIADLHIGLEHELYKAGIVIPSQADKFKKTIDKLIELTKAKTLVILGDIKHKVPGITLREEKEIPKLLNYLTEKISVILTVGNHDTELRWMIPEQVKLHSSRGFKLGKYGFFHGHAWPSKNLMECDHLFLGHIHPAVEFRDDFGFRAIEQVWVRGKLNGNLVKEKYKIKKLGKLQVTILPAFNKLLGGIALNRIFKEEYIGPLLANRMLDISNSKVYMLDGTFLGSVKQLEI
jgi:putative SbcD/Mre11-related phosphoesterase